MRAMGGLELLAIGRERLIELHYQGGAYVDGRGKPIEGLSDRTCFECMNSFYTFWEDTVPFCPACGHVERERFGTLEELQHHLLGQSWAFLRRAKPARQAFAVSLGGIWQLVFAGSADDLYRTGRFGQVRQLSPER